MSTKSSLFSKCSKDFTSFNDPQIIKIGPFLSSVVWLKDFSLGLDAENAVHLMLVLTYLQPHTSQSLQIIHRTISSISNPQEECTSFAETKLV